jgi:hypothetical protein
LRSAAIVGDRAVAVFKSREEISRGGRPLVMYRLVSIDLVHGVMLTQQEFSAINFPAIYLTGDDHLAVGHSSLTRLNPDVSASGEGYKETGKGQVVTISPDGMTLARWSETGTELIDARTLKPIGVHIPGPKPRAVIRNAVLTDNQHWANHLPADTFFLTLLDGAQPRLIYHGLCSGEAAFLSETKIILVACGKATIFDLNGKPLKEIKLASAFGGFAGVSRDGSRFALESSDYPIGDPSYAATEVITIFDAFSNEPLAVVHPEALPECRSWAAFAPDGHQFLSGNAQKLTLYKIP